MVNRHRGETALLVAGESLPMRLTLGALAELEEAFAVDSLPALGERFISGQLSARDIIRIIAAGLRGAGQAIRDEDVAELSFDGGLNGVIAAAITLLEATFGAGDETRPQQPPEA